MIWNQRCTHGASWGESMGVQLPCPGSSVQRVGATEQKSNPLIDTKLYIEMNNHHNISLQKLLSYF